MQVLHKESESTEIRTRHPTQYFMDACALRVCVQRCWGRELIGRRERGKGGERTRWKTKGGDDRYTTLYNP